MNLFTKQKQTHRHRKQTYGYQKGKGVGGINQEFGISRYKLLCIKQINSKVLLCSTGNYIQYIVINHNGKESEKEYIDIQIHRYRYRYITESLCCTPETNTTVNQLYFNSNYFKKSEQSDLHESCPRRIRDKVGRRVYKTLLDIKGCPLMELFFITALLKYIFTYQLIHPFKVYNSIGFQRVTRLWNHHHNLISEQFVPAKENYIPTYSHSPIPLLPQPQVTTNLLSVSMYLPILDISDKWNHVIGGLL